MGMGPCVLASGSNQVLASISVIKKGTSLHPSHEPVLTSTRVPSSSLFHQKVGRALFLTLASVSFLLAISLLQAHCLQEVTCKQKILKNKQLQKRGARP